ncbi:MAG: YCF48-related protein [Ignavibacteria bacterium]|nr:YCF48-related protein [Ignavibacteria bacterium]
MKNWFFLALLLLTSSVFAQWTSQTSPSLVGLVSVSAPSKSVCWIGGGSGVVLRTTDGGTTWTNVGGSSIVDDIYVVNAVDANTCFVSTSPGATNIFRTTNGGSTWTKVYTANPGFIDGICMISATNGYAMGDPQAGKWVTLKTTDGGATWASSAQLSAVGAEAGWNNAMSAVGNNIWFGTNNARVYRSTDAGATWVAQTHPAADTNTFGLCFKDANKGFVGGNALLGTTNAGANWTAVTGKTDSISGIANVGTNWWYIRQAAIYKSTDDGATWAQDLFVSGVGAFNHISVGVSGNQYTVYAVRNDAKIYKYSASFTPVELSSFSARVIGNFAQLSWATASEQNNQGFEIQRSSDMNSWKTVGFVKGNGSTTNRNAYTYQEDISAVNSQVVYYRLRQLDYNGDATVSKTVEVNNKVKASFALDQNYPNPFNPTTTISYSVANEQFVSLKVYNAIGVEVASLVNGIVPAGLHKVGFDATKLGSGIYYYTLKVDGFVKTNKMTVLK